MGVRQISRELVPLLSQIQDSILRAHYGKLLAERLGINDDAVFSQIDHTKIPIRGQGSEEAPTENKMTRRELIERRLFALSLKARPEFVLDSRFEGLISNPVLLRIRKELSVFLEKNGEFLASEFIPSLPAELSEMATSLFLDPRDGERDEQFLIRELDHAARDLELLSLQERINELTKLIRDRESKNLSVEKEQGELVHLASQLSKGSFSLSSSPRIH